MKDSTTKKSRRRAPVKALSALGLLLAWQALSMRVSPILVPSPHETLLAAGELVLSGELFAQLGRSLLRMLAGFALGASAAVLCGVVAGTFEPVYEAFRPLQSLLLGTPPIILVVLALIWFGTGGVVPVFVVAVLVFPLIFLNTADGRRAVDRKLLEMAAVHRVPWPRILRHIVLPALAAPVLTAVSLASGLTVRITVMAELLGSDNGVGYRIALARTNLDTATVFAWTLVLVALVILLDYAVVGPVKRLANRWQTDERRASPPRPEAAAGT